MGDSMERYIINKINQLEDENHRLAKQLERYEKPQVESEETQPENEFTVGEVNVYVSIKKDALSYWKVSARGEGITENELRRILSLDDQELFDECARWDTTCGDRILNIDRRTVNVLKYRKGTEVRSYVPVDRIGTVTLEPVTEDGSGFRYRYYFLADKLEGYVPEIAENLREDFREWLYNIKDEAVQED